VKKITVKIRSVYSHQIGQFTWSGAVVYKQGFRMEDMVTCSYGDHNGN
jgi:hypothetical protein